VLLAILVVRVVVVVLLAILVVRVVVVVLLAILVVLQADHLPPEPKASKEIEGR
jgi:hypothetical protein